MSRIGENRWLQAHVAMHMSDASVGHVFGPLRWDRLPEEKWVPPLNYGQWCVVVHWAHEWHFGATQSDCLQHCRALRLLRDFEKEDK